MLGVISKMKSMEKLLSEFPNIVEVYSDVDFSFEKDSAIFYCVCKDSFTTDFVSLLYCVRNIFDDKSRVYFAHSSMDVMLEHRKLIWRKGSWYL